MSKINAKKGAPYAITKVSRRLGSVVISQAVAAVWDGFAGTG